MKVKLNTLKKPNPIAVLGSGTAVSDARSHPMMISKERMSSDDKVPF